MSDTISFARGAPSLDIVDVEGLKASALEALSEDPGGATGYGAASGYGPLRSWIAKQHGVDEDQVVVTNGSMQADAFLFDALVSKGDSVVVERPTYDRTLLGLLERRLYGRAGGAVGPREQRYAQRQRVAAAAQVGGGRCDAATARVADGDQPQLTLGVKPRPGARRCAALSCDRRGRRCSASLSGSLCSVCRCFALASAFARRFAGPSALQPVDFGGAGAGPRTAVSGCHAARRCTHREQRFKSIAADRTLLRLNDHERRRGASDADFGGGVTARWPRAFQRCEDAGNVT